MSFYNKSVLFCFILVGAFPKAETYFKMTDIHCESFDKNLTEFRQCRLRTLKSGAPATDVTLLVKYILNDVKVNGEIQRKSKKYTPFFFNYTIDACKFLETRRHSFFNMIYEMFKDFTNINHTCPFVGEQIVYGFHLRQSLLSLPLPNGDYLLYLRWMTGNVKIFETNVYFSFVM